MRTLDKVLLTIAIVLAAAVAYVLLYAVGAFGG